MFNLIDIFNRQYDQDLNWLDAEKFINDEKYRNNFIKERILNIFDQTGKLLSNFDWKSHTSKQPENFMNSLEQLVDIFKFSIGLFSILCSKEQIENPAQLFNFIFQEKSKLVDLRFEQNKLHLSEDDSVVIFDIDGVIADYDLSFSSFCEKKGYVVKDRDQRRKYSYTEFLNVSQSQIEKLINEYIVTGKFRDVPIFNETVKFMKLLKHNGYKIILLTARPVWEHTRIEWDTIHWLLSNGIPFDKILFDKDKSDAIEKHIHPIKPLFIIEDRDKHAVELSHLGHVVYLLNRSYNVNFNVDNYNNILRIGNIEEININLSTDGLDESSKIDIDFINNYELRKKDTEAKIRMYFENSMSIMINKNNQRGDCWRNSGLVAQFIEIHSMYFRLRNLIYEEKIPEFNSSEWIDWAGQAMNALEDMRNFTILAELCITEGNIDGSKYTNTLKNI